MDTALPTYQPDLAFTPVEWDTLRLSLKDSLIAETNLCSLAKNLGTKWPIRGIEETPNRYIPYSLEELCEMEEFYGKGNRLTLLYTILLESMQLDDPFAEMVERFDNLPQKEDEARTPLEEMGVPMDFPVELMQFSRRTQSLCHEGGHDTLSQLITFLMESRTATIMNDEFRQFLRCLNNEDKSSLAQFLPIRPGAKGVYLAEAIGNIARRLGPAKAASLLNAYEISSSNPEWGVEAALPKDATLEVISEMKEATRKSFELMPDQTQQLRQAVDAGLNARVRFFVSLNNPDIEALSMAIAMAAMDAKPRFKGFINRFLS
jgi:hypothetical protein